MAGEAVGKWSWHISEMIFVTIFSNKFDLFWKTTLFLYIAVKMDSTNSQLDRLGHFINIDIQHS